MRVAAFILALAPLATTRAEVLHVLEDFSDAQRFFTDAGASLGPGFWDSGAMNATTTAEGALRVDYETWWAQLYGYVQFGRILDDYYPCADATHLSLRYRVTQPQTPARAARMGVVLLDGSDCEDGPGLNKPIVAGAAVTRCGRRAAAGAPTHLVVAARAQVVPADFSNACSCRAADLPSSAGRRVRSDSS